MNNDVAPQKITSSTWIQGRGGGEGEGVGDEGGRGSWGGALHGAEEEEELPNYIILLSSILFSFFPCRHRNQFSVWANGSSVWRKEVLQTCPCIFSSLVPSHSPLTAIYPEIVEWKKKLYCHFFTRVFLSLSLSLSQFSFRGVCCGVWVGLKGFVLSIRITRQPIVRTNYGWVYYMDRDHWEKRSLGTHSVSLIAIICHLLP